MSRSSSWIDVMIANWNPSPKQLRRFAWSLSTALSLVCTWLAYRGHFLAAFIAAPSAAAVAIVGAILPRALRPMYWIAMGPGWLISNLLLAMLYYLLITPLGLMRRLFKHDPLKLRLDREAETYWQSRPPSPEARRYFRQF
jgi:hypothetical protein